MKSFTEYLQESPTILYSDKGWRVVPTTHSKERFVDRLTDDFTYYDLKDIVDRGMEKLVKMSPKKNSSYLVYSSSKNRAIVLSYQGSKLFTIVTILPPGKNKAKEGTVSVMVESFLESLADPDFDGYELLTFGRMDIKISFMNRTLIDYDVNIVEID